MELENEIISVSHLRDTINKTMDFVVWEGSVEQKWNAFARKLYALTKQSFWAEKLDIRSYGYYVKFINFKHELEIIRIEIQEYSAYKEFIHLIFNYNKIVTFVNSEISPSNYMPTLKNCSNKYCLFNKEGICCNKKQDGISPDNLDCEMSIRTDYYEFWKELRRDAEGKINNMGINELLKFIKEGEVNIV